MHYVKWIGRKEGSKAGRIAQFGSAWIFQGWVRQKSDENAPSRVILWVGGGYLVIGVVLTIACDFTLSGVPTRLRIQADPTLIPASIYRKRLSSPCIRPISTTCCVTMTNVNQMYDKFRWARALTRINLLKNWQWNALHSIFFSSSIQDFMQKTSLLDFFGFNFFFI